MEITDQSESLDTERDSSVFIHVLLLVYNCTVIDIYVGYILHTCVRESVMERMSVCVRERYKR